VIYRRGVARRQRAALAAEIERAAAFRSAVRRFLVRTEEIATAVELTPQRYDLLLAIKAGAAERSTVTDLSQRLSLRQTAATELVRRAVAAGLVAREPSTADRRVSILRLTAEGDRRLMEAFVALRDERLALMRALDEARARLRETAGA
jgi:DNA-binding MarR family transcriptional regulator